MSDIATKSEVLLMDEIDKSPGNKPKLVAGEREILEGMKAKGWVLELEDGTLGVFQDGRAARKAYRNQEGNDLG